MNSELKRTESTKPSPIQRLTRFARRSLIISVRVYLVVVLLLILLENKLIFPAPRHPAGDWDPVGIEIEDVYLTSSDGTRLHGWYLDHPDPKAHLLFCHGNGENVAYAAPDLQYLHDEFDVAVFGFDYRGYGRSEGSPHEQGVLNDGEAAQLWLAQRAGIEPNQVVLMGRSLGGAVAIDLAVNYGARGVIVESSFPSLPDVAARLYWWAPVRLVMRTQFDSVEKVASYRGPYLQCHGVSDDLVPLGMARRLFDAVPIGDKSFYEFPGLGHNDWLTPQYGPHLASFIDRLP